MTHDSGSSFVMFVMGIAVGAVGAALYTPVTGAALRRRLGEAMDQAPGMANDALDQADEFVREKTRSARKLVNRAGDAFQTARDEASRVAE
jgi:gas vesicle protein